MSDRIHALINQFQNPAIARAIWLCIVLLDVGLFIFGLILWLPLMQQPCTEAAQVCQQQGKFTTAEFAALNATGWSAQSFAWFNILNAVAPKIIGLVTGFLIFWRKPNDRMAWVASLSLVIGLQGSLFEDLAAAQPVLLLPTHILSFVGGVCFALFFYLFPNGKFVPRWTRWLAAVWAVMFFFSYFLPESQLNINLWAPELAGIVGGSLFITLVLAQVYRYIRASNVIEREQTKWVLLALVVGMGTLLLSLYAVITTPDHTVRITQYWYLTSLGFSALSYLLPIAIGIAILRYRLFDIDIIIRKTLTYAVVVALLLVVYFGSVILLQQIFTNLSGLRDNTIITVISTLAIAALFIPLRNRIQDVIDKRFYRKKYDAQQVLQKFAETVRDETDLDKLTGELVNVVQETMQPKSVSVWLKMTNDEKRTTERVK